MNLTETFITELKKNWLGPTVHVVFKDNITSLGSGMPKARVLIKDKSVLRRMLRHPSMAFGEGYMRGDIEVEGDLLAVLQGYFQSKAQLPQKHLNNHFNNIHARLSDHIGLESARRNASAHYDLGNDFYKLWLDPTLTYSCAYFKKESDNLLTAQRQKLDLICRKARIEQNQKIIDLGCGWGSLLFHAVENYSVHATGVVLAKEQGQYIVEEAKRRGLSNKIQVIIGDWREVEGTYDRVFSVGVMEHVGSAQYQQFFDLYFKLLKDHGIAFLHTIGRHPFSTGKNPWLRKYIFPGGSLPTLDQVILPAHMSGLTVVDMEDLWQHYAKTLHYWSDNFEQNLEKIKNMYSDEFTRMWRLYLKSSEAGFSHGTLQLWQIVMIKDKQTFWPLNRQL